MSAQAKPAMERGAFAKVSVSVVLYFLSASAVPIYNKMVFAGQLGVAKLPYPMATAGLQLGVVALCLAAINVVGHFCAPPARRGESWIFGPAFRYKLRQVAPVGLLFGIKYGVTNWGLQLVPTGTHLLLQSTDLMWTVLFARTLNDEHLGLLDGLAVAASCTGAILVGFNATQTIDSPFFPLFVNLLTPLVLALCITTLRQGTKSLFDPENEVGGSVTATEFTALKLILSSLVAFGLSCALENGVVEPGKEAWWLAAQDYPAAGWGLMLAGTLFVLIFQVNITWLAGLTSATAVGIVGEAKVVPQWLLNAAFQLNLDLTPLSLVGAALSLTGSICYAGTRSCGRLKACRRDAQGHGDKVRPLLGEEGRQAEAV